MSSTTILIADDDHRIVKIISHTLEQEGYKVMAAQDGEEAVRLATTMSPDLVIMDIMMPKLDGLEASQKIKAKVDVPIIILSAKDDVVDKIVGFKMGVDDYQTKPFSPAELALRVKAVLRRSRGVAEKRNRDVLEYPHVRIEYTTRLVRIWGQEVALTAKEFDMLWLMASHPNQVFSRLQLLEKIWESHFEGDEDTVTVHIRRLRRKIEKDAANPQLIKTVWGVGYKFEPPKA
ncbi:response regulator transcription factor [Desulforamulus hydrothermalis]|uniref:Stage 0 sporulation protein A homolog n=1 Tax=Desulforamulus hydrothermalis Lam5 = DSM 18033 TaxID=1121428 RepID=K8E9P0_9FIRM|nr:response regulator transcription factor [Desulforamulus hydrothermalis]CCO08298.1 DNA-binding response regulator in two-component system with YedV [Desulforamulus hydrothermalis Lam5 = DSM 18033]SHH45463.1 DNA-binding response regulator, OmpR family, contains REC and winged-helix (wHTH) domain [Desulforamulus hydrothermalis Lam5 = DSM 18033]